METSSGTTTVTITVTVTAPTDDLGPTIERVLQAAQDAQARPSPDSAPAQTGNAFLDRLHAEGSRLHRNIVDLLHELDAHGTLDRTTARAILDGGSEHAMRGVTPAIRNAAATLSIDPADAVVRDDEGGANPNTLVELVYSTNYGAGLESLTAGPALHSALHGGTAA